MKKSYENDSIEVVKEKMAKMEQLTQNRPTVQIRIDTGNPMADKDVSEWYKHVTSIDPDSNNGYAFMGPFLPNGVTALRVGDCVIRKASKKSTDQHVGIVYRVEIDGLILQKKTDWFEDFEGIKEACIEILKKTRPYVDATDEEINGYISGIQVMKDDPFVDVDIPEDEPIEEEPEFNDDVFNF